MRNFITTKRDLRNWVDSHIGDYPGENDVDIVTDSIQKMDHPQWATDWTEWLEKLPEFSELLPD